MRKLILILFVFTFSVVSAQKDITVEDIYKYRTFSQASVYGLNSMKDGEHYTSLNALRTAIVSYKYETGEKTGIIFDAAGFDENILDRIHGYNFNSDETKILISTGHEQIYRYSFKAEYFVYDTKSENLLRLSENGKQQLSTFSPDGEKIAFVRDNNIFVGFITDNKIKEVQMTFDGERNKIINGAPDWVYEEEFSFSRAYQWSPCSEKIAFYKTDESHVRMFNMMIYGNLYPEQYSYKYPKAGKENSKVSIHVLDINTKNIIDVDLGTMEDKYIPRIMWTMDENIFAIIKLNRLQNKYELFLADANTGHSQMILKIEDEKYIEIDDNLSFIKNNGYFLMTHEKSGFNHIYLYNINGNKIRQITDGDWDITRYYGYDETNDIIYFQAAKSSALNRDVYSIDIYGDNLTKLSEKDGFNNFTFSSGFRYYINYYSNYYTPLHISLHNSEGKHIRDLETNSSLVEKISEEYKFVRKEFFTITTDDDIELNAWMIKPPDFSEDNEYPVFMYVYGGPGSQTVLNSWDRQMDWWQLIAQRGYIVVSVDNRGTGARGKEFRQITYGQLGKYETIDQINAAKFLSSFDFVDEHRIAIFGWSYGGYLAALCMTVGAEFFHLGIAVAPVSNWRHYDTIYTERYNGLPQDNPEGYDENSPVNHAAKLKGRFLLVHGTADDNVHVENTIDLAEELIREGKQFDLMIYPNQNHSISGGNVRLHLFKMMEDFIVQGM